MVGFTIELRIIAQNALHLSIVYKSTHFSSNMLKEDAWLFIFIFSKLSGFFLFTFIDLFYLLDNYFNVF